MRTSIQSKRTSASAPTPAASSTAKPIPQELHNQEPQLLQRLHITPLTEVLLPRILGIHLPLARDISFHQVATFPNRNYGFVSLPVREAIMVRKKLQGTILKGERVAIENARSDKRKEKAEQDREAAENETDGAEAPENQRALRKRKREEGVIATAVELPDGRHVKRGWTEPKQVTEAKKLEEKKHRKAGDKDTAKTGKSKTKASAFTDQEECLFQTTLPQDAKDDSKQRGGRKKTSKKGKDTTVIHEFEKTTKYPSYLRQEPANKKKTQEFDQEKGWVDEDGNVIEVPSETRKQKPRRGGTNKRTAEPVELPEAADDETSSSGSDSDSSSDEEDEQDRDKGASREPQTPSSPPTTVAENAQPSSGPVVSLTEASPVTPHPLETIFKKPRPPTSDSSSKTNLEIDTSFSFFNNNDNAENDGDHPQIERSLETPGLPALKRRGLPSLSIPVTPYNPRDTQWRSQRSAAPTPDTAAPGKGGFGDPFGLLGEIHRQREEDIEEDENEDEDEIMQDADQDQLTATPPIKTEPAVDGNEGDFRKSFWGGQGTGSRAWKAHERSEAKQKRTRESRRRKA